MIPIKNSRKLYINLQQGNLLDSQRSRGIFITLITLLNAAKVIAKMEQTFTGHKIYGHIRSSKYSER